MIRDGILMDFHGRIGRAERDDGSPAVMGHDA